MEEVGQPPQPLKQQLHKHNWQPSKGQTTHLLTSQLQNKVIPNNCASHCVSGDHRLPALWHHQVLRWAIQCPSKALALLSYRCSSTQAISRRTCFFLAFVYFWFVKEWCLCFCKSAVVLQTSLLLRFRPTKRLQTQRPPEKNKAQFLMF